MMSSFYSKVKIKIYEDPPQNRIVSSKVQFTLLNRFKVCLKFRGDPLLMSQMFPIGLLQIPIEVPF